MGAKWVTCSIALSRVASGYATGIARPLGPPFSAPSLLRQRIHSRVVHTWQGNGRRRNRRPIEGALPDSLQSKTMGPKEECQRFCIAQPLSSVRRRSPVCQTTSVLGVRAVHSCLSNGTGRQARSPNAVGPAKSFPLENASSRVTAKPARQPYGKTRTEPAGPFSQMGTESRTFALKGCHAEVAIVKRRAAKARMHRCWGRSENRTPMHKTLLPPPCPIEERLPPRVAPEQTDRKRQSAFVTFGLPNICAKHRFATLPRRRRKACLQSGGDASRRHLQQPNGRTPGKRASSAGEPNPRHAGEKTKALRGLDGQPSALPTGAGAINDTVFRWRGSNGGAPVAVSSPWLVATTERRFCRHRSLWREDEAPTSTTKECVELLKQNASLLSKRR
uniref:Uncharacterized protein n=1 Tax=Trichuris muris TaxID=70415 RepID=A0A5S6Q7R6_TRIMR